MCTTAQHCRILSLRKQWSLHCGEGGYWETEDNSPCHLPMGCLPDMQQDWKVVDSAPSISTAELYFCGRGLCWQQPQLLWVPSARPCCLLWIWSSSFSSDAKHFWCKIKKKCVRGIFLRGKKIQRMAEVAKEEFCVWRIFIMLKNVRCESLLTSSHSHVVYIGMNIFNFTVFLSSDKVIFVAESKLHSKINF